MQAAVIALIIFSVLFTLFGIWLLFAQHAATKSRIGLRLKGVKQINRYELGDALAESREREQRKKERRKEALKKKAYSDIPVLDSALSKSTWADKLHGMLLQAQMPISVTSFASLSALLAAIGVAVSVLWRRRLDPLLAVVFAAVMGIAPFLYVGTKVRRRIKLFNRQLPDALDLLSSSVKSGQSLISAIQNVADEMPDPIGDEFRILSDELTFGVAFDVALRNLIMRVDTPDVRFFASALMIQKETGGNLSEVMDGLQNTVRQRFRILGQVKTLTAQGKLSGFIVGLLPIVLGILIYFTNPRYMSFLVAETQGRWLLAGAGGLQLIGGLLIYKIVNIKV